MADLCSLNDAKAYLDIKNADDDPLLKRLISAVSGQAETHCCRVFAIQTYTETFVLNGQRSVFLAHAPVVAVSGITVAGQALAASRYIRTDRLIAPSPGYSWGRDAIEVTYTAGYAVVPPAVTQAVIETVALRYRERPRLGMASRAMEGASESFLTGIFTPSAKATLDQYREVAPL